ncbi:hypothetical protein GWI33_009063 [Rhynchophorus ferrugineus]|uniref:Ionotropic receptor n=1 Tax=Rhynchophorus ferrugineus TaxID=354439 RepID=A0A834IQ27_RHYFE|nr:hypothetical protein GWI33_009063 [Rhynchophorus ferrugineus]
MLLKLLLLPFILHFSYSNLDQCIDTIINQLYEDSNDTAILYYTNKSTKSLIKRPKVEVNDFRKIIFTQKSVDVYIIEENISNMEETMRHCWQSRSLFERSWYILISNFSSNNNFSFFTKYYISNVVGINDHLDIFTINPYKYENVRQPENYPFKIGNCNAPFRIPVYESPKKWRNTTVREYFRFISPYATSDHNGLEDKLFDVLKQKLEFQNTRRTLVGIRNMQVDVLNEHRVKIKLRKNELDVYGGFFNIRLHDDVTAYDLTPTYIMEKILWATSASRKTPTWLRVYRIFHGNVYVSLIGTIFVSSIILKLLLDVDILDWIELYLMAFMEQPILGKAVREHLRLPLIAYLWAIMIISSLFKNSLIIITASTIREQQVNTIDDILNFNLKLISGMNLSVIFESVGYQRPIQGCEYSQCMKEAAFGRDIATTVAEKMSKLYQIPLNFKNENGESVIHLCKDTVIFIKPIHMIFSKGYPLYNQICDIILRMIENGWMNRIMDQLETASKMKSFKINTDNKNISLNSLYFVFVLWGCGLAVACLVFIASLCDCHQSVGARRDLS